MTTNEIKRARGGIQVNRLEAKDRADALDGVIKRIYALKGLSVEKQVQPEIDLTVTEITKRLLESYPTMTLGEVSIALEAGVTGEYGKDVRLTIANCLVWLRTYYWSDDRKDAIRELEEERKRERRAANLLEAPDDESRDRAFCSEIMKQWRFYRDHKHLDIVFDGFAAKMYDHLVKKGKLRATEDTVRRAHQAAQARNRDKGAETGQIGALINKVTEDTASVNSLLDYATKRELLTMYFDSLIARGAVLNL